MNCVSRPVKSPGICVSLQKWRVISRSPGNVKKCPGIEIILLICTCNYREKKFCHYPPPLYSVHRRRGGFFVNDVSLKYIGMIYIIVGEMCFIPMNVHNELFNGVRQLRWQHLSPLVSTFSTSIRLLYSFFIKHGIPPPSFSLFLSLCLSSLSVVPHPVFLISGLSLRFRDVDVFFLQSKGSLQLETFTIQ